MRVSPILVLVGLPPLLAGCYGSETVTTTTPYPKMTLSQESLDFGTLEWGETSERTLVLSNTGYDLVDGAYTGMFMGVGSKTEGFTGIDIGKGMDGNFSVAYDTDDIECPEGVALTPDAEADGQTERRKPESTGEKKKKNQDSAGVDSASAPGDDTAAATTNDDDGDGPELFVLNTGCSIPITLTFSPGTVGEIWSSLYVESVTAEQTDEEKEAEELPEYARDPIHWHQEVFLTGAAEKGEGTLVVSPRAFDWGYVYPGSGDADTARIALSNVGSGDLTLGEATLSATCDPDIHISSTYPAGATLAAGTSTLVELDYTPSAATPAYCELDITSDTSTDTVDVTLKGNTGSDPDNTPPTVAIRWPEPGYEYNSPNALELEVNAFDKNQPASSLTCKVKSTLQTATLADCTPPDDSGHVMVSIDRELFDTGIDTLTVVVTDAEGISSTASVSVLVNTAYPDSDDDGDGYGVESDPPDCDDHNRNTYPDAAEIYDGEDNDCDGVIDEGTEGFDDDGDGVTEAEGDCNDYNEQAYPGAPERADGVDNDCDGRIDEGTSLYDDDGDGFAEVNNDCDDSDPDVNPSAVEVCDGIDNNCNGLKDSADGCVSTDSEPVVIGFPKGEKNACVEGESIPFTVKSFDADGQKATYSWGDDKNTGGFDNMTAQTVNWTCPQLDSSSGGASYTVYVLVTDEDGHQDWGQEKVSVYPDDYPLHDDYTKTEVKKVKTCATAPEFAGIFATVLAGAAAFRRRRG